MRITNNMLVGNFMRNYYKNMEKYNSIHHQYTSQTRISKPSDDPAGLVTSLRLRSKLTQNAKYKENVADAKSWLEQTDSAIKSLNDVLQRVREQIVYGLDDTKPQSARDAIADEIEALKEEVQIIANSKLGDRYIFGGTRTMHEPYPDEALSKANPPNDSSNYAWKGNKNPIKYEIGENVEIQINVPGEDIFGSGNNSIFKTFDNIVENLRTGNLRAENGDYLDKNLTELDGHIDNMLSNWSSVGARVNRMEMVENRLKDAEYNFTELLSQNEGVDMAKLAIELKNQENVHRASLAAGARIIQPSLVDFLR